jgi:hypothetical protein
MMRQLDEVADLVRDRICAGCATQREACQSPAVAGCVLFDLFPLVLQAILATEGKELADHQRAIRENVCSVCAEAALDLSCKLREQVRCALDLYLAEVVEVVRQAVEQSAKA